MSAVLTGEVKMVRLLLHHPTFGLQTSELETADFLGNTPLMTSAAHGNFNITKILLDLGANVQSRNRWKETALMLAASKGFREVVRLLIQYGADLHAEDITEKTALLRAAQTGHKTMNARVRGRARHHWTSPQHEMSNKTCTTSTRQ